MRGRTYRGFISTFAASTASTLAFSPHARRLPLSSTSLFSTTSTIGYYEKLCVGGDFAGLQAKFSPIDGCLIPVPVHLVPASLLEWGQEPTALEVLVSEEFAMDAAAAASMIGSRQELTVLPATGCAVDNLETMKSEWKWEPPQLTHYQQPSESTLLLDSTTTTTIASSDGATDTTTTTNLQRRLETQFSLPGAHRARVVMNLNFKEELSYEIQSPILLYLERQSNATSSHGTRADGGGLDGRTVSQLLGEWLRKSASFAEQKYSPGEWKALLEENGFVPSRTIHLPGNITIATGPDVDGAWLLETSHFTAKEGSTRGSRRILQRKFKGSNCETIYKEEIGEYVS